VIEPSNVPVPDKLLCGHNRKNPFNLEHESYAPAVVHDSIIGLFLDLIKVLEDMENMSDPKVSFSKSRSWRELCTHWGICCVVGSRTSPAPP
jgi:hypothetical protein